MKSKKVVVLVLALVFGSWFGPTQAQDEPLANTQTGQYTQEGIASALSGNYTLAREQLSQALSVDKFDYDAQDVLTIIIDTEQGRLTPEGTGHLLQAESYLINEQFQEAIDQFQQGLGVNPDYALAYVNLGVCYSYLGQNQQAIDAYQKAVQLDPNRADAYCNLSAVYSEIGQYQDAVTYSQKSLQIDPNDPTTCSNLASAYIELGQTQEALNYYEQAIQIDPGFALAYEGLARAYLTQGQYKQARENLEKAKALYQNNGQDKNIPLIDEYLNKIPEFTFEEAITQQGLTTEDFNKFTTYYYQNPQPEKLFACVKAILTQNVLLSDAAHFSPFIHLLSAVAYTDSNFQSMINGILQDYSGVQKQTLQQIIDQAQDFQSPAADSPQHLDYLWAEFSALGQEEPVKKIIGVLSLPAQGMDILLIGAAEWSLQANARQHPKVRELIVQETISAVSPVKEKLEKIINQSEQQQP